MVSYWLTCQALGMLTMSGERLHTDTCRSAMLYSSWQTVFVSSVVKEARELGFRLHRELGRELQLDGKLNSVSFMITKIDQYQTRELLEEEGRLNEWRELDERLSELEEAEDQSGENIMQEELEELKTIKEEMRAIEMTCLRSRNERLVQMVRETYREQVRELRRGRMGELPDVNVFCTSAVRALAPRDRNTGIRWVAEDTGIPQLKNHLQAFAVNQTKRLAGKNLGSVTHRVATFAMVIKSTFGTENRTFRSNYTKEILGNSVLKLVQKEIDDWNRDLWREIEKHKLITELKRGADQAKRGAVETQSEWRSKLMWNTYRCAMGGLGDFYSSGRWGQIKMNKALVNPILEAMGGDWEEIFELIRDLNGKLIEKIKSQLSDWEEHEEQESTNQGGAAEGIETEEAHYIRSTTRRFVTARAMSIIQEEIENHVQWTSRNQSEGWRKIEPHIKTSLSSGYSTAATESGSGMFDRMHYTMIDEIRSKEDMFHQSIKHPINELNELVSRVKDGVNGALRRLEQRILMEDSSSTLQTRNAKDYVPLLSAWKEEANKIIEITDELKLEVNRESKRQLIIEVIRVRDFLKTEDLTSQMEDLGLNDESHNNHCVICLDGTPIWVAVHGNKSHNILCDSCKNEMEQRASQPIECPVCRQRVERFTTVVEV